MPDDPFVVHVARLRRVTGARWHEVRQGELDPEHLLSGGGHGEAGAAGPAGAAGAGRTRAEGSGRTRRRGAGPEPAECSAEEPAESSAEEPAESSVPEGAQASADLVLQSFDGGVMASGTVGAPWRGVCRRCTAPVGGELRITVRERFTEPGARYGDPEDDEAYPIVDDRLDLRPMVRDAVVLELPLAPLCRDDCRGLCPQCGIDRNVEACACVAPRDPRWANLDVLRTAR